MSKAKKELNVGQTLDNNKIELTKQGLEELKTKLNHFINIERPKYIQELAEARAQGDLSENADYDAAKNKQAEVESEIIRIEDYLTRAKIIDNFHLLGYNKVEIGATVTYKNLKTDEKKTIKIVGVLEVNPTAKIPLVSVNSPIAKALWGLKTGAQVRVLVNEPYEIVIKKIV